MRIGYLLVASLIVMSSAAMALDLPGDALAGRAFAVRHCAGCHAVAAEQRSPAMDGAPAFLTLARDPAISELSLRAFLQTPHSRMPNIMLTRREIDDVISYILSMRVTN
jgi:mono/diheme cytochrome c family protein